MTPVATVMFVVGPVAPVGCSTYLGLGSDKRITVSLKNPEVYRCEVGMSGDEVGASIKRQASHFTASEIVRNTPTNWSPVCLYQPSKGYVGTDSVEIQTIQVDVAAGRLKDQHGPFINI
jgi:hypothetical protein